jgi:hypothetical protein
MHVNDVFSFFKNYFWHQYIRTIQNIQTILNFNKKKNSKFFKTHPQPRSKSSNSLSCEDTSLLIFINQTFLVWRPIWCAGSICLRLQASLQMQRARQNLSLDPDKCLVPKLSIPCLIWIDVFSLPPIFSFQFINKTRIISQQMETAKCQLSHDFWFRLIITN